jgi:hypothetical protein
MIRNNDLVAQCILFSSKDRYEDFVSFLVCMSIYFFFCFQLDVVSCSFRELFNQNALILSVSSL